MNITVELASAHPTGMHRWHVSPEAAAIIREWHGGDTSKIRNYRAHKSGGFGFTTGVGYAIFDMDLLGGDGSGKAERAFEDSGHRIQCAR